MCAYNTPMNTLGVGDPVPYSDNTMGSGDIYGSILPKLPNLPKKVKKPSAPKMPKFPFMKKAATNLSDIFQEKPLLVMKDKK